MAYLTLWPRGVSYGNGACYPTPMTENEEPSNVIEIGGPWHTITNRMAELADDDIEFVCRRVELPDEFESGAMVLMRWRTLTGNAETGLEVKVTSLVMVRVVGYDHDAKLWAIRTPEAICSVASADLRLPTQAELEAWERDGSTPEPWP